MSGDILTADILATEATDGEVRAQLGDAALGKGFAQEVAIYGVDGFVGRPNPPDAEGNAAQALYLQDGDDTQIIGTRDNRWADKVGTIEPGDRAIISSGEARFLLKNERDAIVLYTADSTGKGLLLDMGGTEKEIKIVNAGKTFITMTQSSIVMGVDGGGSLTIDADGVRVTGASFQAVTGSVQLGDQGGGLPPPPLPPALGVAYGVPGPIVTVSTKVFVAA